jgi:hypothetical protein
MSLLSISIIFFCLKHIYNRYAITTNKAHINKYIKTVCQEERLYDEDTVINKGVNVINSFVFVF